MKKHPNTESPVIDSPLTDQPDREHGNPLKLDRTRDDIGKKIGQHDRRRISANFPRPKGSISLDSFDSRRIRR